MSSVKSGPFLRSHLVPNPGQMDLLRDLLRSNALPPETSNFRNVVEKAPGELARYATEIGRLQDTLARLIDDRDTLASYAAGCHSLFASARRVPTELLVEMFHLTSTIDAYELFDDTTPEREVERLAKSNLLDLSQVCSHWYGVVMGTPRLWAAFAVDITLWRKSNGLNLVATLLQRSANCPLSIQIAVDYGGVARKLMTLLVQHSHRWKEVYFWMHPRCFEFIAGARGNLPILDCLKICGSTSESYDGMCVDAFEVAPRLATFSLYLWSSKLPALPSGQLIDSAYGNRESPNLSNVLKLMRLLPTTSRFTLYIETEFVPLPVALPSVTSNVAKLTIVTTPSSHPSRAQGVLAAIMDSLVLPSLKSLRFLVKPREARVVWAETSKFMAFASRSSLHSSLIYLEIRRVIQDDELLQCLSALPLLETLKINDFEDHAVVTDNLLRRMTWAPDQDNLIPRLSSLLTASLFKFQEAVLHDFIVSRIISRCPATKPFELRLRWLPNSERQPPSKFGGVSGRLHTARGFEVYPSLEDGFCMFSS